MIGAHGKDFVSAWEYERTKSVQKKALSLQRPIYDHVVARKGDIVIISRMVLFPWERHATFHIVEPRLSSPGADKEDA